MVKVEQKHVDAAREAMEMSDSALGYALLMVAADNKCFVPYYRDAIVCEAGNRLKDNRRV